MSDDNDVSYSVFLEHKKEILVREPLRLKLPRRIYTWVDDNTVFNCYNCNKQFTMFLRRHHCRFCGKIFCSDCTNFQANIPIDLLSEDSVKGTWNDYVSSYIFSKDPSIYKVCKSCLYLIESINSVKKIIEVFIILNLDIKNLKKASFTCRLWHNASNYILSIIREIQYKLPMHNYTSLEKTLLWNNINYLAGHNKYLIHLIKLAKTEDEFKKVMDILKKEKCNMLDHDVCQKLL